MKVLISPEYSYIELTVVAAERFIELSGCDRSDYIIEDEGVEYVEISYDDSFRTDPLWIQVYEEIGPLFSVDAVELVEIPDNSNFYIQHHDWAGENVVLQTFDFDKNKIKSLLPGCCSDTVDEVISLLRKEPNLLTIRTETLQSSVDSLYNHQ
jgi:hypothetical protein